MKKIVVKVTFRESEYGKTARFEFPDKEYIYKIFVVSVLQDLSKYKFHFYKNILVSRNYSSEVEDFLKKAANEARFEIELRK